LAQFVAAPRRIGVDFSCHGNRLVAIHLVVCSARPGHWQLPECIDSSLATDDSEPRRSNRFALQPSCTPISLPSLLADLKVARTHPLFSFVFSKGHCKHCQQSIAWRYPLIELITSLLFTLCLFKFGFTAQAAMACFFSAALLALAWIDAETFLLPDTLTQALLWVGLIGSAMSLTNIPLVQSLAGAVLGYAILWAISWVFSVWAGKEGMGQGDLKLLAGLGAWMGLWTLLPLLLLASVSGLIFGVIQKMRGQLGDNGHFAFGPFLALSGFACFFLGISMGV